MSGTAPLYAQLSINEIVRDPGFQIRGRMDRGTVVRYANNFRSGTNMPAVKVARTNGVFVLVDGWHRVAALEALGETKVEAEIHETTREEARWMAAQANLSHGLPLRTAELRLVFRAYIRAGKHKGRRGKYQSYREIGTAIGKPHTTIRNWMIKDFPSVATKITGSGEGKGGLPERPRVPTRIKEAREGIQHLLKAFQGTGDEEDRLTILQDVEAVLATMKETTGWTEPSF